MKYFKKLVGDRIYLSPKSREDAIAYTKWLNDFRVTDYTGRSGKIMSLEGEMQYLDQHINDEAGFSIINLENDKLIGVVGLENIDQRNRSAVLGIMIGEEENREQGYGTEAIRIILEYGFQYLNLNSIQLKVFEFNERAIACYKKCGFQEMGRKRKAVFLNGKYYDSIYMDILKEEFDKEGKEFIRNKNI